MSELKRNKKASTASKVETGAGAALLAGGVGAKQMAFGAQRYQAKKLENKRAAARDYLSQGGKSKRDPSKVGLNTTKKKAALRTINETSYKLKHLKPSRASKGEYWVPAAAAGAALAIHGGRKQIEKRDRQKEFAATGTGAAGGVTGYMMTGHAFKYGKAKPAQRKQSGAERARVREYNKKAIPKGGMPEGDPRWTKYWRNYPKDVGGGKVVRTLGHTHGGKTGAALYATAGAAGAAGANKAYKKFEKSASLSAFGVNHG